MQRRRAPNWLTGLVGFVILLGFVAVVQYGADHMAPLVAVLLFVLALVALWHSEGVL